MEKFQAPSIDKEDKKADILEQDQDLREEELGAEAQIEAEVSEASQEMVVESSVEELVEENKEEFLEPEIEMKDIEKKYSERLSKRRYAENIFTKISPQDYRSLLKEEVINKELYKNLIELDREISSIESFLIRNEDESKNEEIIKLRDKQAEAHRIIEEKLGEEAIQFEMSRAQAERDIETDDAAINKEWNEVADKADRADRAFHTIKNITEKDLQSLLRRQDNAFNTLAELMEDEKIEDKLFEANNIKIDEGQDRKRNRLNHRLLEANNIKIDEGQDRAFKTFRDIAAVKISPETDREKLATTLTPWRSKKAKINYLEAISRLNNQGTAEMIKYFRGKEKNSKVKKSKWGSPMEELTYKVKDALDKHEVLSKFVGRKVEFDDQTKKATPNQLWEKIYDKKIKPEEVIRVRQAIVKKNRQK